MNKKQNVLVVTSRLPFPINGGDKLRLIEICKTLSTHYDIHLLSFGSNSFFSDENTQIFSSINVIPLNPLRFIYNSFKALFSGRSWQCSAYFDYRLKNLFLDLVIKKKPKFILLHLIRMSWLRHFCSAPVILELTDAISLNYSRIKWFECFFSLKKLVFKLDSHRLLQEEISSCNSVIKSFVVSDVDQEYLCSNGANNLLVASNGISSSNYKVNLNLLYNSNTRNLLFIGNIYTAQNQDMVIYFMRSIMPLLDKRFEWCLHVIGKVPTHFQRKFANCKTITFHGFQSSYKKVASECFAGICPMRFGAGVQNKVLDFISIGLPVVSSRIGLEGLPFIPSIDLFVADNAVAFADSLNILAENSTKGLMLRTSAQRHLSELSWENQLYKLVHTVKCL